MAIAVISDIHGNAEALDAVLRHIRRRKNIKQVFFLGDAIGLGPDGGKCLKRLKETGVNCVLGCYEQQLMNRGENTPPFKQSGKKHMEYIFNELDTENLRFISEMPEEIKINYKGFNMLFTHYALGENCTIIDHSECREDRLNKLFEHKNCDVVFLGHHHQRKLIINEAGKSYLCVGSSGCVKGDKTFYTYFDVLDNMGEDLHFNVARVNIKFSRKRFDTRMQDEPLPDKEKYGKYCFGLTENIAE